MRDSDITRPLLEKGALVLQDYLDGKLSGEEKEIRDKVKLAMSALLAHQKMKATENNEDGNKLGLAKLIFKNAEEKKTYMEKMLPHMMLVEKT